MVLAFVTEDFYSTRFGEDTELNVIDDFLRRRGWREKVAARRYLQALRDYTVSLYEVVEFDPGSSMTVRDLIVAGDPTRVEESGGSDFVAPGDRLAARLVTVNGKPRLTGGVLSYPLDVAQGFLTAFEKIAERASADLRSEVLRRAAADESLDNALRKLLLSSPDACRHFTQALLVAAVQRAKAQLPDSCGSECRPAKPSEVLPLSIQPTRR